jgi:signal transduction histidine kinase
MTATQPADQPQSHQPQPRSATPTPAPSAHRQRGFRSWWESVAEWRNWRLPVKVAAVLAVPAIATVSLSAVQISNDVSNASSFATVQRLIALRNALIPLTGDLQTERWLSAQKLGTSTTLDVPAYKRLTAQVDRDAATVISLGKPLLDPAGAAGIRYQGLVGQLAGLPVLHQQALTTTADVVTVVSNYGQVINAALDLDAALTPQLADPQLTSLALALNDLEVANEQVRQQQTLVTVAIARGNLLDTELQTVQTSDILLQDRLNNFQVGVTPDQLAAFQDSAITNDLNNREQLAQQVLSNGRTLQVVGNTSATGGTLGVAAPAWIAASDAAAGELAKVSGQFSDSLTSTSANLRNSATRSAVVESVVLLAILLLAIGVGVVIGRNLLRSLNILRRTALEVAEHQLPDVVASIDKGNLTGLDIEPVPVHTHEELGQLARAFDAVHGQAVRSAVGQATLRSNLRNIFINLSRRSQSLVERQLRLMERLERNEEDPQQLANLFKLDHLATRMRRNNENLMVLSGDDPARRSGGPLALADVVRAAVSEIEHYQRVVVRSTPSVDVLGYASGDLTRLIAELLDNATSFSPPQAQVFVGGKSFPDGSVRIEIRDDGIGMAAPELADANGRLNAAESPDVPVSRQMGLYVVGRLARRHSIRVVLEVPADGGLLAVVQVPAELVKPGSGPVRSGNTFAGNGIAVDDGPLNGSIVDGGGVNGHAVNGHADVFGVVAGARRAAPDVSGEWAAFRGSAIRDVGSRPNLAPTDFTWFVPPDGQDSGVGRLGPVAPVAAAGAPPVVTPSSVAPSSPSAFTAVGLPRRVPRSHAVPSLVEQRPAGQPAAPAASAPAPVSSSTTHRNPSRTRGFLNDYQAGVRQGAHSRPDASTEASTDHGNGEDR